MRTQRNATQFNTQRKLKYDLEHTQAPHATQRNVRQARKHATHVAQRNAKKYAEKNQLRIVAHARTQRNATHVAQRNATQNNTQCEMKNATHATQRRPSRCDTTLLW